MATLEEAQRCPKCKTPGNIKVDRRDPNGPRGQRLLNIYCENERCSWNDTCWQVSVRPDGSIPDPEERRGPKQFIGFEGHDALAEQLREAIRLQELSTKPGAEIKRRPR